MVLNCATEFHDTLRFLATSTLRLLTVDTACELARPGQKHIGAVITTAKNLDKVRKALHEAVSDNLAFAKLDVADAAQADTAVTAGVGRVPS